MCNDNQQQCEHLREFLDCQIDIIQRHLEKHKWFNQIPTEAEGIRDFIKKYGWLMRDLYCRHACEKRGECKVGLEN